MEQRVPRHRLRNRGTLRRRPRTRRATSRRRSASLLPRRKARAFLDARRCSTAASGLGLAAVGFVGGKLVNRDSTAVPARPASFLRLTFRRGLIRSARFGPDGQTILYAALWNGERCRVHSTRHRQSRVAGSRPACGQCVGRLAHRGSRAFAGSASGRRIHLRYARARIDGRRRAARAHRGSEIRRLVAGRGGAGGNPRGTRRRPTGVSGRQGAVADETRRGHWPRFRTHRARRQTAGVHPLSTPAVTHRQGLSRGVRRHDHGAHRRVREHPRSRMARRRNLVQRLG